MAKMNYSCIIWENVSEKSLKHLGRVQNRAFQIIEEINAIWCLRYLHHRSCTALYRYYGEFKKDSMHAPLTQQQ